MSEHIQEQLNKLEKGIRQDVTLVADFFDVDTPLKEYAAQLGTFKADLSEIERQEKFKHVVREELGKVFSAEEIQKANINWAEPWYINIIDHHGVLNHPLLVSTNIIASMDRMLTKNPEGMIVLSYSAVPMNNFFHKRGVKFDGKQLNLFPAKYRHGLSYDMPVKEDFRLVDPAREQGIGEEKMTFLQKIQDEWNAVKHDTRIHDFVTQIQRINYAMWKQLFHADIRDQVPDVMYIPNELVVARLLEEYVTDSANLFYKILCDKNTRDVFLKTFDGVTGCWDGDARGSQFFWGLNDNHEAVALHVEGEELVSNDVRYDIRVPLTADGIVSALQKRQIFPTMFLVYGVTVFYCGIRPLVGFGSMNYQTAMKGKWVEALKAIHSSEVDRIENISTRGFIGGPKVTYGVDEQGDFTDPYALDIIYNGGLTRDYIENLQKMKLNDVLRPALVDIYDSYVRPEHKEEITVTSTDLLGDSFAWLKNLNK